MHGIISLSEATSYDNVLLAAVRIVFKRVITGFFFFTKNCDMGKMFNVIIQFSL